MVSQTEGETATRLTSTGKSLRASFVADNQCERMVAEAASAAQFPSSPPPRTLKSRQFYHRGQSRILAAEAQFDLWVHSYWA
jgi:hypothetical protein